MKKQYEAPRAEKLEFNYTEVVTSSDVPGGHGDRGNGNGCQFHGDRGQGKGCRRI